MLPLGEGSSFEHLDEEDREKLVALLERRIVYYAYKGELARMQIEAINNPSPESLQRMADYAETHIAPMREDMEGFSNGLKQAAINKESLVEMLPMVSAALAQSVDIQLILMVMDMDPDMIMQSMTKAQEFFRRGLE